MARKYVRDTISNKSYTVYESISNGIILTDFCEKDGVPIVNNKFFVSRNEFVKQYVDTDFSIPTSEKEKYIVSSALREINSQLINYGIIEGSANNLMELEGSSPRNLFLIMATEPNLTFEKATDEDEDYEFSESEDAFNFIYALVPILKKVIAQSRIEDIKL